MKWLKWIGAILLFIVSLGLIKPAGARKWQEKAVSNEEKDIAKDLDTAAKANEKAKQHDDKAHAIKAEAEKDKENETTSSILDRWRKP